jgi:hypothetical protein
MKKNFMLIPIVLLAMISKTFAQQRDSVTLVIDYFDGQTGNKYGFAKKYDHIPTSNDSIVFKRECLVKMHIITDSLRTREITNKPNSSKKETN